MLIRKLLITTLMMLLTAFPGFSQPGSVYYSGRKAWKLPYTGAFRQKINFGNDILEELAKDLLKPPGFVNLTINFREEIRLQTETPSIWTATINLSDFNLSGDLQYRSFPISGVLMPSGFRLALRLSTKLDTLNCSVNEFEGNMPGRIFSAPNLAIDTAADTLIAGNYSFIYSDSCWQKFYDKKNLIDDYYASAALLDSLSREEQGWDMRDPQQMPYNFIRLSELVRIVELVGQRDFGRIILEGGNDPRHLLDKHLAVYKVSRTCLFNLAETLEKSGAVHGYSSLDSVSNYFISRLMRFIRLSSLMDNIQGRVYKDYLSTYYSMHVFEQDPGFIQSMLIRMFPDARPDTLAGWASESLMRSYRRKARELIAENNYSDAVLLMENARSMAAVNPYLKNHNSWEYMMSEAVNGIYNAYAGIASSSLEGGNVKFAMEYLQKAEKYRELYPVYITSDSLYHRVYRSIFIGQLDRCNSLLDERNYSEALECLNSCEQTYSGQTLEVLAPDILAKKEKARMGIIADLAGKSMKAIIQGFSDSAMAYFDRGTLMLNELPPGARIMPALDSLSPSIAIIRVKKINALASAYFIHRQFSRAIIQFEMARKISAAYSIPSDRFADSLYQQSNKQWLLDRISKEQRLIWNNEPDSAAGFLLTVIKTAQDKGLETDPDILNATALFKSGISRHNCELMEDSLGLFNIRAGRCFAIHSYHRGAGILESAIQQAGKMAYCNFDLSLMRDSLIKYNRAAEYQKNIEEVDIAMVAGEYEKGLQILVANEKLYTSGRIDHFGIPMTSVYDYVTMKSNPFISMQAIDYYLRQDDPVEALRYLGLLRVQGLPEERSLGCQEKLARSLALKDKAAYGNADPQQIVRRYSAANSWMNRFNEVYLREWKK